MTVARTDIEKALDELISNEEGMRFQGLAVVLAKHKWPGLVATERKKDLGLDAYVPAPLAEGRKAIGLACSLTATLGKIKADIKQFQRQGSDIKVLVFATPRRVTTQMATGWKDAIRKEYGVDVIVISREDIITDLMMPANASLCRTHLYIPVAIQPALEEILKAAREAASQVGADWLAHRRLADRPTIALQVARLDHEGRETGELLDLANLHAALLESRRIVLEAPAGRGKTTTLVQLAEYYRARGDLAFLIDLPTWVASRIDLLEFIARAPAFRSRGLGAGDLARLYEAAQCSLLLNGWNEVSDSYSEEAVRALADLERNFPKAGIIVATRVHHIRPPLPGSFRAALLPLSRAERTEYLQRALPTRAEELGSQLEGDRVLNDLTRTPLILAEVTVLFQSGAQVPKTKTGVLAGVMRMVEHADEHRVHLEQVPLSGHSREYLAELAARMTTDGEIAIEEAAARSIVFSVGTRLMARGQIARVPEPAVILGALCAHHVLERMEYPSVRFKFEHQQFQEFYAAGEPKRQLSALVGMDDPDGNRRFARDYLNKPVWEEPLRMMAEEIGELSREPSGGAGAVRVGRRLIELALDISPVFAGELSRLCGAVVWREVRGVVGDRLRSWYRVADDHHRRCALAGMLASGSDDFIDILVPLLTSDDQQVRLNAYRSWGEVHVSSLGNDWQRVVAGWNEEQRADFIGEVVRDRGMADIAEELARVDPSTRVRTAAIRALWWVGASDALVRVLSALGEEAFEEVLQDRVRESVPAALQGRALATYKKLLPKVEDPRERLRNWLAMADFGGERISDGVKDELTRWPSEKGHDASETPLKSALDLVRKTDPQWVSHWVADRIVKGVLWADPWIAFVSSIPETLTHELLERISGEDLERTGTRGIVSVLAATAGAGLAGNVFSRLCKLRTEMSGVDRDRLQTLWTITRQLEELFRAIPPDVALPGMLSRLSAELDPVEFTVAIELVGRIGTENRDLRGQVQEDHRQRIRGYFKAGVPFALSQDDFNGYLKMHLALALARVGDPDDMAHLRQLIQADIERLKRGRAALLRREQSPMAAGAAMSCSNWHTWAVTSLDPQRAEGTLVELLYEPEYERDAAGALVRLARAQTEDERLGHRRSDYRIVWEARGGRPVGGFDEDRRKRYTATIKQRISAIVDDRAKGREPTVSNGRLKGLARTVAIMDGRDSADFVLDIMALPGEWDGWTRVEALEALLFSGARLGTDVTLSALNPTIAQVLPQTGYDPQAVYLLQRCLCLLAFLDRPSIGIARIREVLATKRLRGHELREVVTALGHSRCHEALGFLLELAATEGHGLQGIVAEWIGAVAALDTADSRRVLLSFVDPDIQGLGISRHFEHHDRERLASFIADIARAGPTVRDRLYLLCARELSPAMRGLLVDVIARLGTPDALLIGMDLIRDHAEPPVPYELVRGLESVFLERRPYGDTGQAYTLQPQSANEIRARLFEMLLNDDKRRRSASTLLARIESWRLEYGRPIGEPRHPALEAGEPWPPVRLLS